jgi:hypothetical protein
MLYAFPTTNSWDGSIDFLSKWTTYQGISPIIDKMGRLW